MHYLPHLWWVILLPLCTALVMAFSGDHLERHSRKVITTLCTGSVMCSFLLALAATWEVSQIPARTFFMDGPDWLSGLPYHDGAGVLRVATVHWGLMLDALSAVLILVVTGVGSLIHLYSIGYMRQERSLARYFGYLNLFVAAMLLLVLADNYVLLFAGWEGVGLASFLLIGFHRKHKPAIRAATKAFLVNRVGDIFLLFGIFLIASLAGSVRFAEVMPVLRAHAVEAGFGAFSLAALCLLSGAVGKSAQFPLYVWLPDAMEGPTPVSALIHAATMVTAGVYLIARSSSLFELTPVVSSFIAYTGALTAILAASLATVQNDIKRVLAFSTVSQLGYMFMALGAGAYWTAVFHLFTHAFFKALLFLGAGAVIHALDGEQNLRCMGGLRKPLPFTFGCFAIGSLAIAGVPGLAGFFSKDEVLLRLFTSPVGFKTVFVVGLITSFLTAFYMGRALFLAFFGPFRQAPEKVAHIHEPDWTMRVPLAVLAFASLVSGYAAAPRSLSILGDRFHVFEEWLDPVFVSHPMPPQTGTTWDEAVLMILSGAIAIGGLAAAWFYHVRRPKRPQPTNLLYLALANNWYLDHAYELVFVRGVAFGLGCQLSRIDHHWLDGVVRGVGALIRQTSRIGMFGDRWIVDGLVRATAGIVGAASYPVRLLQTGRVQAYFYLLLIGLLGLAGWAVWR